MNVTTNQHSIKRLTGLLLAFLLCLGLFSACKSDDTDGTTAFDVDKAELDIPEIGSVETLTVQASDGNNWTSSIDQPWIQLTPSNGTGTTACTVKVDNSVKDSLRSGSIRLMDSNGNIKNVKVVQSGHKLAIQPDVKDTTIASSATVDERKLKIKVTTNVKFSKVLVKYQYAEGETQQQWLQTSNLKPNVNLEYDRRPVTVELSIPWEINTGKERKAKIYFTAEGVEKPEEVLVDTLTITQKGAPVITDDRAGDSLALITIAQRLGNLSWDTSQNMIYWSNVELWEPNDPEAVKNPDMAGRVRKAQFSMVTTKEGIPFEVKYLKYAESLAFTGNANPQLQTITIGGELNGLKYLKNLSLMGFGVTRLSTDFASTGQTLEYLNLASNNLTSGVQGENDGYDVWNILNKQNFPKLKQLMINANRITSSMNMQNEVKGLKMNISGDQKYDFIKLLQWDTLDSLALSVNYIYGQLPTNQELLDQGFPRWQSGDTFKDYKGNVHEIPAKLVGTPKVLPNTKYFAINLNFLTGTVPDWILYHPHLDEWAPYTFIFNQEEGTTPDGKKPGFSNEPTNLNYYYENDWYPWKKISTEAQNVRLRRVRR